MGNRPALPKRIARRSRSPCFQLVHCVFRCVTRALGLAVHSCRLTSRSTGRPSAALVRGPSGRWLAWFVRRQVPHCPNCQTELAVPYSLSGEFKCPSCGTLLQSNVPPLLAGAIILWVPLALMFSNVIGWFFGTIVIGGAIALTFWVVIVLCCRVRLSSSSAERDA
jgi:hypothetical protein